MVELPEAGVLAGQISETLLGKHVVRAVAAGPGFDERLAASRRLRERAKAEREGHVHNH